MILRQVLQVLESTQEPTTLAELGRKLDVEPDALRGMIQFLVQKGRLGINSIGFCATRSTASTNKELTPSCFNAGCVADCWQAAGCSEEK